MLINIRAKKIRRVWRRFIKQLRKRNKPYLPVVVMSLLLMCMVKVIFMQSTPKVDPHSYNALLNTIAEGESKGNYNAYYGHPLNSDIDFTNMTVVEVLQWQQVYVQQGSPSSAVGKYQIVRPTLSGLVQQLNINPGAKFDSVLQDRMAIALLERRGSLQFVDNILTRDQFAANIAQEWAALPKTVGENPGESYYAGDGLNKAHISVDQVYEALSQLRKM